MNIKKITRERREAVFMAFHERLGGDSELHKLEPGVTEFICELAELDKKRTDLI